MTTNTLNLTVNGRAFRFELPVPSVDVALLSGYHAETAHRLALHSAAVLVPPLLAQLQPPPEQVEGIEAGVRDALTRWYAAGLQAERMKRVTLEAAP